METNASNELCQTTKSLGKIVCQKCGELFDVPPFKIAAMFVKVCPDCSEKAIESERKQMIAAAQVNLGGRPERWVAMCPPLYAMTEAHKLPSPSKLDAVMRWQFNPRGLILHGDTARGKTRCAYALMKREFLSGRSIAILDASFGLKYAATYSESASAAQRYIEHKCMVELLLLDDVIKIKLTDSVEQALFMIVNTRIEQRLPIVATMNDSGDSLTERMSLDRGPALIRRLREFCETIAF